MQPSSAVITVDKKVVGGDLTKFLVAVSNQLAEITSGQMHNSR
jgi:hypothetical protein